MSDERKQLTALVVTRDRAQDLAACVESLLLDPRPELEVLVVQNGATTAVRTAAAELERRDTRVRSLVVEAMSPSLARNRGAAQARGELVFFVDDDVIVHPGVVERIIDLMGTRPELGIVGGPNLTPPDDPEFAQIAGALLASRFGSGIARPRYAPRAAGPARESDLVLCNLIVRRSLLDRGLTFPRLFGGEENVLMGRAEHHGVAMWYEPEIAVDHRRRRTLAGHVEQVHRYGEGRANAILSAPNTFRIAYLVPPAFVLYLASLPFTVVITRAALIPLGLYLLIALVASVLVCARHRRASWAPALLVLYPITHVAYGIGLIARLGHHVFAGAVAARRPREP